MKRWIRNLGGGFAISIILLSGCLEPPSRPPGRAGAGSSEATAARKAPSDIPVTLAIKSSSWTVKPGRTFVTCEFVFENASAQPVELLAPVMWELELTTPSGDAFDSIPAELAGEKKSLVIPAGDRTSVKIFNLKDYFGLIVPGSYTLRAVVRDRDGREVASGLAAVEVSEEAAQAR